MKASIVLLIMILNAIFQLIYPVWKYSRSMTLDLTLSIASSLGLGNLENTAKMFPDLKASSTRVLKR